jgi:hypothetical protein
MSTAVLSISTRSWLPRTRGNLPRTFVRDKPAPCGFLGTRVNFPGTRNRDINPPGGRPAALRVGEQGAGVVVRGRGVSNGRGLGEKEVESGWWIRGNGEWES